MPRWQSFSHSQRPRRSSSAASARFHRRRCRWPRPPDASSRSRPGRRSTCLPSAARRWTATPYARRTRPEPCPSSSGSRRDRRPRARSRAGEAMAVATGGVVPDGADAVIQHERVVERDNASRSPTAVAPEGNIRDVGGDAAAGAVVVAAGMRLRPCADRCPRSRRRRGGRLRAPSAGGGPDDRNRAAAARHAARPRPDLRVERGDARRPARDRGGGRHPAGRRPRRRGRASSRDRARAGARRARHLGRGLRRPARSRPPGGGGARRRGGVLGGGGTPGQAGLVRRPRRRARLRTAGEPGVDPGRLRALRPTGSARAPGLGRSRAEVRLRQARGGGRAPPGARRPAPGPLDGRRGRCGRSSPSAGRSRT